MKVALYTRVSTDEQVEKGNSLDAQKRRLYEYCYNNNYEVYQLYSDEGISGFSVSKRPAIQSLLKDAKNRKFEALVVYKTDRLSRNLLDLLTIKQELDKYDVELIFSDESIDTNDDTGMAMFSIMGAFAELERKKITERMMTGKREMLKNKHIKLKHLPIPSGYLYDDVTKCYVVDERYRQDIINIFGMFDLGYCYNQIAKNMASNNINFGNPKKVKWYECDVVRIIRNPIYKGFSGISYANMYSSKKIKNEPILYKCDNVEPIVSEELWDRCYERAKIKQHYFVRKYPSTPYIFSGLIFCNVCGKALGCTQTKMKNGNYYYYYICRPKDKATIVDRECNGYTFSASKVNLQFVEFLKSIKNASVITSKCDSEKTLNKQCDNIRMQITSKQNQRRTLLEKLANEVITDDDYKAFNNKISVDIDALQRELSILESNINTTLSANEKQKKIASQISSLKSLAKSWDAIPNEKKRLILHKHISKVLVEKGKIVKIEFK